jgi:mono/diheme cytochrome c family protein
MKRGLALILALSMLGGCAFLERIFAPPPPQRDRVVSLAGPVRDTPFLVEPQVTVMAPVEVSTAPGAAVYTAYCRDCHGRTARGDGRFARDLPVKPADLTTLSVNAGGSFPAARVIETVHGYPGQYHRGLMPEFGATLDGPLVEWVSPEGEVILTPRGLLDVVIYLESLQV